MKILINLPKKELVEKLWSANIKIEKILKRAKDLHEARDLMHDYLNNLERRYFSIYSNYYKDLPIIEKNNAKECIRVLKNIIRSENEHLTNFSALKNLHKLAQNKKDALTKVSEGFLCEFYFLFKGILGNSEIPKVLYEIKKIEDDKEHAQQRSKILDSYSQNMQKYIKEKYITGFDDDIIYQRKLLKNDILNYFKADESDWLNYRWHLKNIIKDMDTLSSLVKLNQDEIDGLKCAEEYKIPYQITPYYLSLFNKSGKIIHDRSIRAQVIPTINYCKTVEKNRCQGIDLDFMGEKSTSPHDCITRRYPQIIILKPFDTCPQICVYCQRNWEIKGIENSTIKNETINQAIEWVKKNKNITEVLVTGGDPLMLNNKYLESILEKLSKIKHLERIRIGTRVLVTLPFRINDGFLNILKKYHQWGKREICIVTHFEYPSEITPEALEATKKLKNLGINIYNQAVFTYFNSRKFVTNLLRNRLKLIGIDPYYTFNMKGKDETIDFRVPIARIEQERKEEARLLPGMVRTDEPVFNVPKLGKSHLRAGQDHEPIMILADGRRVYRFYPWESKLRISDDYLYTDVSIYDFLKKIYKDGDNLDDYRPIWYYF